MRRGLRRPAPAAGIGGWIDSFHHRFYDWYYSIVVHLPHSHIGNTSWYILQYNLPSSPLHLEIITAVSAAGEEHEAHSMGLNYGDNYGDGMGREKTATRWEYINNSRWNSLWLWNINNRRWIKFEKNATVLLEIYLLSKMSTWLSLYNLQGKV
jgi:hypothetical protein